MNFIVILLLLAFFFFGILIPFYLWIEEMFKKFKHPREYKRQKAVLNLKKRLTEIQMRKSSVEWYSNSEGILEEGRKEMEILNREEREISERLRELHKGIEKI
jgi:hypothetical protein